MKTKKYYVYIHLFPNGKRYVGLTTQNVNRRWNNGKKYKHQKVVYNAILKYGWDNISHQVFECDTEAEMKYLERYLIRFYNTTDHRYGYNVSEGGEGAPGVSTKPIDQYDKKGVLVRTWESAAAIERELNYSASTIAACAKRRRPTAYNCYWVYSGELPDFKTYKTQRKVRQFDLKGNLIAEFKNALEAGKSIGKPNGNICSCCNGKRKSAYNYFWSYENNLPTKTL